MDSEGAAQGWDFVEADAAGAAFDGGDDVAFPAGPFGELGLCEILACAFCADCSGEDAAQVGHGRRFAVLWRATWVARR